MNLRFKPPYLILDLWATCEFQMDRTQLSSCQVTRPSQEDELRTLDVADMGAQVRKRQMEWFHCPIPDCGDWGPRIGERKYEKISEIFFRKIFIRRFLQASCDTKIRKILCWTEMKKLHFGVKIL